MSDSIQLLVAPDPGWHWSMQEVWVDREIFWAAMQQRDPPPPAWWEPLVNEAGYSQGLAALMALVVAAKRFWAFWQRRKV